MRAFDRWRRLTRIEKRLTLQAAMLVVTAIVRLRVSGVKAALRWAHPSRESPPRSEDAGLITEAVARAGRYTPAATCLPQSLALARMLRGRGIDATVRVGVSAGDEFAAHAWVDWNGKPLTVAGSAFTALETGSATRQP
jgi:transglutaminase-like putative cysteine protease